MNLRTYLMIKEAGNPVNKLKLKTFKGMTDPDYVNSALASAQAEANRRGVFSDVDIQSLLNEGIKARNNELYGQPTIPDDVVANPGQGLRDRGLDKMFGNDDEFKNMLEFRRKGFRL